MQEILYHGSKNGELLKGEDHKYNCLYCTTDFAYAALYSADFRNQHGCIFKMQPIHDLKIFDARNEEDLARLKQAYTETQNKNKLKIDFERLKNEDWSTVCNRQEFYRDKYLLPLIQKLGYDGYFNFEWDEGCAQFYAEGTAGCGLLKSEPSYGIFDEDLLEIVDTIYYEDYDEDEKFVECYEADRNCFISFLQDEGLGDAYYNTEEGAREWAGDNVPFLDVDEVNDLIEEYANCYDLEESTQMRVLKENRFHRDEALVPENIIKIFEAFGWTENRDWLGRDDDLTFIKGPDRVSFNLNPRAGYDFILYKNFEKDEYSADYMMYSGVNCSELENDCRDFDNLTAKDYLKYQAPKFILDLEKHLAEKV